MNALITINDVARAAQVSTATVSLALNGHPCVKQETRERIIRIAKELGYSPNRLAQGLARRKSGLIGLAVPDIESLYYGKIVRHIDEAAGRNGYQLTLAISNDNPETERKIIGKFIDQQVEGLIVAPINQPVRQVDYYQDLTKVKIPYAFITAYYPQLNAPYVMADLQAGSRVLAEHLLDQGRRDLYFLSGCPEAFTTQIRKAGLEAAVRRQSKDGRGPANLHMIACRRLDYAAGFEQTCLLLKQNLPVDVIITINDEMALGALNAVISLGFDVPGRMAVAGYDNMIFSSAATVPITTVDQNIALMCRQAVDMLLAMMKQTGRETAGPPSGIMLEPRLIIRRSTERP